MSQLSAGEASTGVPGRQRTVQVCLQQFAGLSRQGIQRLGLGMLYAYDKLAIEDFLMAK